MCVCRAQERELRGAGRHGELRPAGAHAVSGGAAGLRATVRVSLDSHVRSFGLTLLPADKKTNVSCESTPDCLGN